MSTRTSRHTPWSTSRHHTGHHWSCLANLGSSNPTMHLRSHGNSRLLSSTRYTLSRRMALRHRMTAVDRHTGWVLRERLRHAHHGRRSPGLNCNFRAPVFRVSLHVCSVPGKNPSSCTWQRFWWVTSGTGSHDPPVSGRNAPTAKRSIVPRESSITCKTSTYSLLFGSSFCSSPNYLGCTNGKSRTRRDRSGMANVVVAVAKLPRDRTRCDIRKTEWSA